MPLIDTSRQDLTKTIHEIVRESVGKSSLSENLEESYLTIPSLLDSLRGLVDNGQSDAVRLSAIKTALEMHGSLGVKTSQPPVVNITINGSAQVNPILLPRELINA